MPPARGRAFARAGLAWAGMMLLIFAWRHAGAPAAALAEWRGSWNAAGAAAGFPARAASLLGALAAFALLNAALWRAGELLLGWLLTRGGASMPPGRRLATALLLGWLAGGLGLTGLAFGGLFHPPLVAAMAFAGAATGLRSGRRALAAAAREFGSIVRAAGAPGRAAAAGAILALGYTTACALAPETGVDALIHNLGIVARLLRTGRLLPQPGNAIFHVAAHAEVLRAAATSAGGAAAARLFGPAATALTSGLLTSALAGPLGPGWACAAAAAYATAPQAALLAMTAKPDALLPACALAAALAAAPWAAGGSAGGLVVAGLLLGLGGAMKYSAGTYAVALALACRSRRGHSSAPLAALAAAAALPVLPWLAKSWLLTGNPFYPFAYGLFGGTGLSSESQGAFATFVATVNQTRPAASIVERLGALFTLTLGDGGPPAWLALLPLALAANAGAPRLPPVMPAALLGSALLWLLGPLQLRYLLPALPLLLALTCATLARFGRLGAAAAGAALAAQLLQFAAQPDPPGLLAAGLGLEPGEALFRRKLPLFALADATVLGLPARARVICIGHEFGAAIPRDVLVPSPFEPFPAYALLRASPDAGALWRRFRQLGATHLLYNPTHAAFHRRYASAHPWNLRDVGTWSAFWTAHAREVFRSPRISPRHGDLVLYELLPAPASPPAFAWLPGIEGVLATVEGTIQEGRMADAHERLAWLEGPLGRFGQYQNMLGRIVLGADPAEALRRFEAARATGYRDLIFYEDLRGLAARLGRRNLAARVAAERARNFGEAY